MYLTEVLRGIWCSVSGGKVPNEFLAKRLLDTDKPNKRAAVQGKKDRKSVENSGDTNIFWKALVYGERADRLRDIAQRYIYN